MIVIDIDNVKEIVIFEIATDIVIVMTVIVMMVTESDTRYKQQVMENDDGISLMINYLGYGLLCLS